MVEPVRSPAFGFPDRIRSELEEIGENLTFSSVLRHFEIDSFPGVNLRGSEVHGVFFNKRHDRSVSVWIAEFHDSIRADGLGCKVQLWGKPETGKPDAHHNVRLSKQISVPVCMNSIQAAICDLLPEATPVGAVP